MVITYEMCRSGPGGWRSFTLLVSLRELNCDSLFFLYFGWKTLESERGREEEEEKDGRKLEERRD